MVASFALFLCPAGSGDTSGRDVFQYFRMPRGLHRSNIMYEAGLMGELIGLGYNLVLVHLAVKNPFYIPTAC